MADTKIPTTETEGNPNDTTRQERESDADFEARIAQSLAHHVGEYVKIANEARTTPRVINLTHREQLRRGTHNRLEVACGYVSLASKMLEWAADHALDAEKGYEETPALEPEHLETLARLLGRAAKGMEQTLNNADAID